MLDVGGSPETVKKSSNVNNTGVITMHLHCSESFIMVYRYQVTK